MAKRYYAEAPSVPKKTVARDYSKYEYRYEVSGSAATSQVVPLYEPQEEFIHPGRPTHRKVLNREEQKKLQRAKAFNLPAVLAATVCMAVAAASCMSLVGAQGELNSHIKTVKKMQSSLATLTERNDLRYNEVVAGIDYTEIYDYAINTLGMKQPGKNQVKWYDSTESEYIVQYDEIPNK